MYVHLGLINGIVVPVGGFPYKSTIFHTNSACTMADTTVPSMGVRCSSAINLGVSWGIVRWLLFISFALFVPHYTQFACAARINSTAVRFLNKY